MIYYPGAKTPDRDHNNLEATPIKKAVIEPPLIGCRAGRNIYIVDVI
jgi:hypothetical protein